MIWNNAVLVKMRGFKGVFTSFEKKTISLYEINENFFYFCSIFHLMKM